MNDEKNSSTDKIVGSTDGLERCPFCGSRAKFGKVPDTDYRDGTEMPNAGGEYIECANNACAATTMLIFPTMADAKPLLIEKWNKRYNAKLRGASETSVPLERLVGREELT